MKKKLKPGNILPEDFLQGVADEMLGIRKVFNLEDAQIISNDKWFSDEVKKARNDFNIPNLKLDKDIVEIHYAKYTDAESKWFLLQPQKVKHGIYIWTKSVIDHYGLQNNWLEWIKAYLLYRKTNHLPLYNLELTYQILDNLDVVNTKNLTTKEKDFVKAQVRQKLEIKGKPPKKLQKAYREFLNKLESSKNKRRRMPTLTKTIKVVKNLKNNPTMNLLNDKSEWVTVLNTYRRIVANASDVDDQTEKRIVNKYKKRAQRLRQKKVFSLK